MAVPETIPIPLTLPRCEAQALAQFTKRIDRDTVAGFAGMFELYDSGTEADVMWNGVNLLRSALAEAGFAPR
jgi:hypothetical protein